MAVWILFIRLFVFLSSVPSESGAAQTTCASGTFHLIVGVFDNRQTINDYNGVGT